MGAANPAIDAMIDALLSAEDEQAYIAAIRALDRVLTAERYVIPLWYEPTERIAWWKPLEKPDRTPLYGYRPEVWWRSVE
jgi:peptide/nickel transport system substrate-binding protein